MQMFLNSLNIINIIIQLNYLNLYIQSYLKVNEKCFFALAIYLFIEKKIINYL